MTSNWQPGRWWRVIHPNGRVWMETSDENEAKQAASREGFKLYRSWYRSEEEWRAE